MTNLTRRGLLGALICAPAIVRASSLMKLPPPHKLLTFQEILEETFRRTQQEMMRQMDIAIYSGYDPLRIYSPLDQLLKERSVYKHQALSVGYSIKITPGAVYSTVPRWQP